MNPEISRRTALEGAAAFAVPAVATSAPTAHAADGHRLAPAADNGTPGGVPAAAPSEELAHYYRFQEIVEGRRMVYRSGQWRFEGSPVELDPKGIYPMIDDPDTSRLPEGSPQRKAAEACDQTYTTMLVVLQSVFDGHPGELRRAAELMTQLEKQAHQLAEMPRTAGGRTVLGPAFRFIATGRAVGS
ncbi:hypothetical protein [Streptomyces sp. B21-083]|uniref:hypothetical protein n=1 Tax=Streptomyces sp. B21-083 TaxID=3039410 RepID=UPI002FF07771